VFCCLLFQVSRKETKLFPSYDDDDDDDDDEVEDNNQVLKYKYELLKTYLQRQEIYIYSRLIVEEDLLYVIVGLFTY
jgi:hypothetical protein